MPSSGTTVHQSKILTVVGARPQFIKAAVVSRALAQYPNTREILVHTGQHYDDSMSDVFFRQLGIPAPTYQLNVGSAGHGAQTGRMLEKLDEVMRLETPDWVLVYGDTNSTLAGALAAAKLHFPVAHVEAGLRSYNRAMPEEINRLLTDQVSDLLFAPTDTAVRNLAREGIAGDHVRLVGDVMFDATLTYAAATDGAPLLAGLGVAHGGYVLATIHRAENTDCPDRLAAIAEALIAATTRYPVVLPLHPRAEAALTQAGLMERVRQKLICIGPLSYLDMLIAERHAHVVVTDSGGVQKEAFFAGVPCIIVRPETEWVELVEMGCARLVEPAGIAAALAAPPARPSVEQAASVYGGGTAAGRVAAALAGVQP